jgi:hypothetical protein
MSVCVPRFVLRGCNLNDRGHRCAIKGRDGIVEQGPDDGGRKHLRNVGQFISYYTAQHPRRQYYSAEKATLSKLKVHLLC